MTANSYIVPRVGVYSRSYTEALGFLFWFYLGIKPMVVFLFANDPAAGTLAANLLDAAFFSVIFLSLVMRIVLHRLGENEIHLPTAAKLLITFLAWSAISLLWTHADSLNSAAGYWGIIVLDIVIVLMLIRMSDLDQIGVRALQGLVLGTTLLAFLALAFVSKSGERLGDAELLHPNSIGNYVGVALLCNIYLITQVARRRRDQLFWMGCELIMVLALLRSMSKTSMVAIVLAGFVYLLRSNQSARRKWGVALLLAGALAVATPFVIDTLYHNQTKSEVETFSGRTQLWLETWDMIRDNPVVGYGFFSFRNYGPQIFSDIKLVHAHNEWLNLWFSLGLVGVVLAFLIYATYLRQMFRISKWPQSAPKAALAIALVSFTLVRGITEATNSLVYPMALMFLILVWTGERRMPFYRYEPVVARPVTPSHALRGSAGFRLEN